MLKIPILTYHSMRGHLPSYESNDHIALEEDLRTIQRLGYGVVPLRSIARFVAGEIDLPADIKAVGLAFDDGSHWDWYDFDFPGELFLKGMRRILQEAGEAPQGAGLPRPTATSFVIVSPEARFQIDARVVGGRNAWTDKWWREAASGSVIDIGNHSWDHLHPAIDQVAQREQRRGTFLAIDTYADADAQIRAAEDYIDRVTGDRSSRLFAYPFGEAPGYLADEYFPKFRKEHRQEAAFTTGGDYAVRGGNRWRIPRFTSGEHWTSPAELEAILGKSRRVSAL